MLTVTHQKPQKSLKTWYYSASRWLSGVVMVGNITFLVFNDFCGFRSVAVNTVYKLQLLIFIIIITSCWNTGSERLHHCCHLSNKVENTDHALDIPHSLQRGWEMPPQNLRDLVPQIINSSLGPTKSTPPKWHADLFSHFWRAYSCDRQTDTQATLHL